MGMPRVIKKGLNPLRVKKRWNNKSELRIASYHHLSLHPSFNILINLRKKKKRPFINSSQLL